MDDEFGATVGDMDSEFSATGLSDDLAAEYRANSDLFPEMDTSNTAEDGEINTTKDTAGTEDLTQEFGPVSLPVIEWISSTRGTDKPFVDGFPFSKQKASKADPDVFFWHCDSFRDKDGNCHVRLHTNLGTPAREAMFPIALWTAYERTLAGEDRTNNFAEAAHRKLQSLFGVDHPKHKNVFLTFFDIQSDGFYVPNRF